MDVRMRYAAVMLGAVMMVQGANASPLGEHLWKDRVLVVSAPPGDEAADEQRRIYRSADAGMAERQIVLVEALDDGERSRQVRSAVSANGRRF